MKILTWEYFLGNPKAFWKFHYYSYHQIKSSSPNISHHLILRLQESFSEHNRKISLITQNVDDYHAEVIRKSENLSKKVIKRKEGSKGYGQTEGVLEIHGNWKYMRCSNDKGKCKSN
jgi:NAD-dependent SIR2 family protein deacetylase